MTNILDKYDAWLDAVINFQYTSNIDKIIVKKIFTNTSPISVQSYDDSGLRLIYSNNFYLLYRAYAPPEYRYLFTNYKVPNELIEKHLFSIKDMEEVECIIKLINHILLQTKCKK